MKQSDQYRDIVNWYNTILDRVSQAKDSASDLSKEAAINEVLSQSLISLWKSVKPFYVLDDATKGEIVNISNRLNSEGIDKFRRKGQKGEFAHNIIQGIKSIFGKSPSAFFENQFIAASKIGTVNTKLPPSTPIAIAPRAAAAPVVVRAAAPVAPAYSVKDRMRKMAEAAGNPAARLKVLDLQMSPEEAAAVRDLQRGGKGEGLSKASQAAWRSQ